MLRDRDFCAEVSLATVGLTSGAFCKRGGVSCVSNPDFSSCSGLCDDAGAQGTWLETRLIRAICSSKAMPAVNTDRLARRLNLTDPQKAALKDLADASASADASAQTSLCADKPDFSTTPGRMAFAEKMAEAKLAGLKAVEPKLQAFYDSLDAKQKKAFDSGGRIGGIFDWWRER